MLRYERIPTDAAGRPPWWHAIIAKMEGDWGKLGGASQSLLADKKGGHAQPAAVRETIFSMGSMMCVGDCLVSKLMLVEGFCILYLTEKFGDLLKPP